MSPKEVVRAFVEDVRSGAHPDWADKYMAREVQAHQIWSENPTTVMRTPAEYQAHVEEFLDAFGRFDLKIDQIIAEDDLVYVRWSQFGRHLMAHGDEAPTGASLTEMTSAVYRVENGKIAEYWLQFDRKGMEAQVAALSSKE